MDAEEIVVRSAEKYSTCATYQDRGYAIFDEFRIEFDRVLLHGS